MYLKGRGHDTLFQFLPLDISTELADIRVENASLTGGT
jgi:hypothetical protein